MSELCRVVHLADRSAGLTKNVAHCVDTSAHVPVDAVGAAVEGAADEGAAVEGAADEGAAIVPDWAVDVGAVLVACLLATGTTAMLRVHPTHNNATHVDSLGMMSSICAGEQALLKSRACKRAISTACTVYGVAVDLRSWVPWFKCGSLKLHRS